MKTSSGKVRKRKSSQGSRRKLRGTVVKMLAIMESNPESAKSDPVSEFLVTGRTGRRNAMADILGPNASVTSGDLPKRLESLTTTDRDVAGPSSSSSQTHFGAEESEDVRVRAAAAAAAAAADAAGTTAADGSKPSSHHVDTVTRATTEKS